MERRGRIPVATFRTPDGKTRSRSRVRDPNYNKSDPETDLFTLLEDNIALREENESVIAKNKDALKEKEKLERENTQLKNQIKDLTAQQDHMKSQIMDLKQKMIEKTNEAKKSRTAYEQENMIRIKELNTKLEELQLAQKEYSQIIDTNKLFKEQIDKLLPTETTNEFESLIDTQKDLNGSSSNDNNFIAIECIQKVLSEFTQLKISYNNVELQLYEANEKISELLENQNHFEEENENLRLENTNLTKVAELMTTNMKESVNTSKKMEEALLEMKRRNEELQRRTLTLDSIDGSIDGAPNEEIVRLHEEITKRDLAHGERIVEMKKLMDKAIENTSNDEIKILRLKLETLETQLKEAIERAQTAENQLESLKKATITDLDAVKEEKPCMPPPPPPPLPNLQFPSNTMNTWTIKRNVKYTRNVIDSLTSSQHSLQRSHGEEGDDAAGGARCASETGIGGGSGTMFSTSEKNLLRKQQVEATGIDALVNELKCGNVTLRRARRKTRTNVALQEMFDVLEISRTQNRNSAIFIKNHIEKYDLQKFN